MRPFHPQRKLRFAFQVERRGEGKCDCAHATPSPLPMSAPCRRPKHITHRNFNLAQLPPGGTLTHLKGQLMHPARLPSGHSPEGLAAQPERATSAPSASPLKPLATRGAGDGGGVSIVGGDT